MKCVAGIKFRKYTYLQKSIMMRQNIIYCLYWIQLNIKRIKKDKKMHYVLFKIYTSSQLLRNWGCIYTHARTHTHNVTLIVFTYTLHVCTVSILCCVSCAAVRLNYRFLLQIVTLLIRISCDPRERLYAHWVLNPELISE